MKLVDILAQELKEWPEGAVISVQDGDRTCKFSEAEEVHRKDDDWLRAGNAGFKNIRLPRLAEDYATAIVTRAQWQAAVEALRSDAPTQAALISDGYLPPLKSALPMPNVIPPKQEAIDWPSWATHRVTTGPDWDGSPDMKGSIEFAVLRGESYHDHWGGEFDMDDSSWIVLDERANPWNGEGLPPVGTVCELRCKTGGWGEAEIKYQGRAICVWLWIRRDGNTDQVEWAENPERMEFRPILTPEQIAAEERETAINELAEHIAGYMGRDEPEDLHRGMAEYLHDNSYRKQVQP